MKKLDRTILIDKTPRVNTTLDAACYQLDLEKEEKGRLVYKLTVSLAEPQILPKITVHWRVPAVNFAGEWRSNAFYDKRKRADWEFAGLKSRVSTHAPVVSLFGHDDSNVLTFATSEMVLPVEFEAPLREEDNYIYAQIHFFTESYSPVSSFESYIYIDQRNILFTEALKNVSRWWEAFTGSVLEVPPAATEPLYSTWYSYHQNFKPIELYEECVAASKLGYKVIIVDDGWQTLNTERGYAFTGDWEPERIPETASFVDSVHSLGMKVMFWYSVPFCGTKSKAYERFKDKVLTSKHHWAPVLDPRYPEVRAYIVDKYAKALIEWGLDGFKLDFIDDFKYYSSDNSVPDDDRDFNVVEEGAHQLFVDIITSLKALNPSILIEFRQDYIGPAMRKFGNMFRAFDCPNDAVSNRIRTTDIRLLAGDTAVHSDMICWNMNEPVEVAALQFINVLFSVPQISVQFRQLPEDHLQMLEHLTAYWIENKNTLLQGEFVSLKPLLNYPLLKAIGTDKIIQVQYNTTVIEWDDTKAVDVFNGTLDQQVFLKSNKGVNVRARVYSCVGDLVSENIVELMELSSFTVPTSGLLKIEKT